LVGFGFGFGFIIGRDSTTLGHTL